MTATPAVGKATKPAWGGSGGTEGRDSWCTPKWLTDLLGGFDLDPCGNSRSHVQARHVVDYQLGGDGCYALAYPRSYKKTQTGDVFTPDTSCDTFINPPYARGQTIKWVRHWTSADFTFLLRWDPSTKWFAALIRDCEYVWFPNRRINFEPPPGVVASSNPFPHALYIKNEPSSWRKNNLISSGYLLQVDHCLLSQVGGV